MKIHSKKVTFEKGAFSRNTKKPGFKSQDSKQIAKTISQVDGRRDQIYW